MAGNCYLWLRTDSNTLTASKGSSLYHHYIISHRPNCNCLAFHRPLECESIYAVGYFPIKMFPTQFHKIIYRISREKIRLHYFLTKSTFEPIFSGDIRRSFWTNIQTNEFQLEKIKFVSPI